MPSDEEIRELCARALTTHNGEFESAIRELQSALRLRLEELSNITLATLLKFPNAESLFETGTEPAVAAEDNESEKSS